MKNFTKAFFLFYAFAPCLKSWAKDNNTPVPESFRTNLYIINSNNTLTMADGNLAQYNNSFSAAVDFLDAAKLVNINETLGLLRQGFLLSIERRPIIGITDTLFFNLTRTTQRNYQFQFTATALNHPGLTGMLEDSYTGISTPVDLNGTTSVNFSIDSNAASQDPNRFMVVFGPGTVTPLNFISIAASQQGANAAVSWSVDNELNIKQYKIERSTDGINFVEATTINATGNSSSQYNWVDASVKLGNYFYRIESIGIGGSSMYSNIVKMKVETASQSIAIYPNPMQNGIVGLHFNNMPKGIYNIRIISLVGQDAVKAVVNNCSENSSQKISLDKNINKGIYQLEVIGPDNNKTSLKLLNY